MTCSDEQLRAAQVQLLFMALGQRLGLNAAYHAFGRAAELEDRSEVVCSAAWQVLGRTIIVALSSPRSKTTDDYIDFGDAAFELSPGVADRQIAAIADERALFAAAPDLRLRTRRIANNLGILLDAGRKGGTISSRTVYGVAKILGGEIGALLAKVDRLLSPDEAPRFDRKNR